MEKTIITIEETVSKDTNNKTILKRSIKLQRKNTEKVIYEDSLSPLDLHKKESEFNRFERWLFSL